MGMHKASCVTSLLLLGALVAYAAASASLSTRYDQNSGRLVILLTEDGEEEEVGYVTAPSDGSAPTACEDGRSDEDCLQFTDSSMAVRHRTLDDRCLNIKVSAKSSTRSIRGCLNHRGAHIYGGIQKAQQTWPAESDVFDHFSYVPKKDGKVGIAVRYWLFSDGRFVHVPPYVPLFVEQNTNDSKDALCFIAENTEPYPTRRQGNVLEFNLCTYDNVKQAHEYAIENFLGKPEAIPDERMATHPVWSTWARHKKDIDDATVRQIAADIIAHGFNESQLQVDDYWENCYGSLTFDTDKFPDVKTMVDDLHKLGYRVTLWVHPFVNQDCEPYYSQALASGYFVTSSNGTVDTQWWRGVGGVIDFTNSEAAAWWACRVWALHKATGIDSFKFDAGETSWLPYESTIEPLELNPVRFTDDYVKTVSQFGPLIEVRSSVRSQQQPVFFRMFDKHSSWSAKNGLRTLIPSLLHMNVVGHPFVLPDMIGGNVNSGNGPDKELYIRWLEATVFMPALQMSIAPWDFDDETVEIARNMTSLHVQYAPRIVELMQQTVQDGSPVNLPIWWLDPTDDTALTVDSEFLLGEDILVAPVVTHSTTARDIYLPKGNWRDEVDPAHPVIEGPTWLRKYPAPLNTLPYFTRVSSS
ncbi:myogenesis-regulating glycosidase-like [Schistocerca nitens]|uniref:myogenesis-regulating glycosidase-like n=1 Tax=Schistocerca nitens TaxID=7011 RepID=UPI0021173744|nr:myogenesis-regulating glycosidase-like [Schistocerca nitens]